MATDPLARTRLARSLSKSDTVATFCNNLEAGEVLLIGCEYLLTGDVERWLPPGCTRFVTRGYAASAVEGHPVAAEVIRVGQVKP